MGQGSDSASETVLPPDAREKRLVERFREAIRSGHYSRRTEQTYWYWVRYFVFFHGRRHPRELGAAEVTAFLSWLATERNVAAATQNQALAALLFLYKQVLDVDLPWLSDLVRAQRPVRLPTVLSEAEVRRLLAQVEGVRALMVGLLYGAGLRQIECLSLRVKDVDFAYRQILVRDGKGRKDRVTMLPESLVQPLQAHLGKVRLLHRATSIKASARCRCLMHSLANTRAPAITGPGSSFSPPAIARPIPRTARSAATTSTPIRSAGS